MKLIAAPTASLPESGVADDELSCGLDNLLAGYDNFLMDEAEAKKLEERTAGDLESARSVVSAQAMHRLSDTAVETNGGRSTKTKPTTDPTVADSLYQYNETAAATRELVAKDVVEWQQQFEAKLAALSEECRLDREARAEALKLTRLEREEARK